VTVGTDLRFAPVLGEIIADALKKAKSDPAQISLATGTTRGKAGGMSRDSEEICSRRPVGDVRRVLFAMSAPYAFVRPLFLAGALLE